MKKAYTKPRIFFDSFAMCTEIAGSCTYVTNTPTRGGCGLEFTDGITIFTNIAACNFKVESTASTDIAGVMDGEFNGICYHVPAGTKSLFGS